MNDEEWQATGSGKTNGPTTSFVDARSAILDSHSDGVYLPPRTPISYLFFRMSLSDSDGRMFTLESEDYHKHFRCTNLDCLLQKSDS